MTELVSVGRLVRTVAFGSYAAPVALNGCRITARSESVTRAGERASLIASFRGARESACCKVGKEREVGTRTEHDGCRTEAFGDRLRQRRPDAHASGADLDDGGPQEGSEVSGAGTRGDQARGGLHVGRSCAGNGPVTAEFVDGWHRRDPDRVRADMHQSARGCNRVGRAVRESATFREAQ